MTKPDRQAQAPLLDDHDEELEPLPVSSGFEQEIDGPDLVRVLRLARWD